MNSLLDRMADFLLENANPSIRLRIMRDHTGTLDDETAENLRAQIRSEEIYRTIAACQKENGWLGNGFHGPNKNAGPYENQECGCKYLAEKAVGKADPVLRRAMEAFTTVPLSDECYRTKGKVFDEFEHAANGQNLIRCACIARAAFDDEIDIRPQIQLSLDSFRRVTEVDSILDISRTIQKGKYRVFNKNERWPSRYHFDILAHTDSWKTPDNIDMLAQAFKQLMRRDRPELIGVGADSWVGYKLGTLGCMNEGFSVRYERNGESVLNLEALEWLSRMGLCRHIQPLADEVEKIAGSVDEKGICRIAADMEQLRGISTYGGQQLEADHKTEIRRLCDITFRAAQILRYSVI